LQGGHDAVTVVELSRDDGVRHSELDPQGLVQARARRLPYVLSHAEGLQRTAGQRETERSGSLEAPARRRILEACGPRVTHDPLLVVPPLVEGDAPGDHAPPEAVDGIDGSRPARLLQCVAREV